MLDIMMPYYGDVATMQAAVHSILTQTDNRWRLTVIDDGTEPGVPEWFDTLNHHQVRYLRNEYNLGVTGNFQRCVDLAEHDYLVIMGCDDLMLPTYVTAIHDLLDRFPQASIIQPGVQVIDTDGHHRSSLTDWAKIHLYAPRFADTISMRGEPLAVSLLRGDWLYFPSLCWRTKDIAAAGFNPNLTVIQDLDLLLRLTLTGAELVASRHMCFQYRRHAASKSSTDATDGSRFLEAEAFFYAAAADMTAHGWPKAATTARRHLSSRLLALSHLPTALSRRDFSTSRVLTAHTFGRAPKTQ